MLSTNEGLQAVPVDVPGVAGAQLRATGMSVDQGLVRVELLGLGGAFARTAMLSRGESVTYEGMTVTLFDREASGDALSDTEYRAYNFDTGEFDEVVGGVIEARARVGRLRAAEVAYAEHLERRGRTGASPGATAAIERARRAMPEQVHDPERARAPFVGREEHLARLAALKHDHRPHRP